jgi:hypothetical protein
VAGAVREARVLERDEHGRGLVVEYAVDARVKTVRYRLRQIYDEPRRAAGEYLGGDFRDFAGEWRSSPPRAAAPTPRSTCASIPAASSPVPCARRSPTR